MASRNNSDDVNADSNKKAEEKLISATELKLEGNNFYGQKNYKEAVRRYHRALMFIKGVESDGSDLIGNMQSSFEGAEGHSQRKVDSSILEKNQQLKMDCLNNLSACLLLSPNPNYEKIISYCKQVLEFSPTNCKAHFRLAQAQFKVGDYDGAMQSINNTEKFQDQPDSRVSQLKALCKAELSKQTSTQKVMYTKMLGFQH